MEQKPPEHTKPAASILNEISKRKAQAQKDGNAFGRFTKGKTRPRDTAKPAFFGGRNGQGKP